MQTFFRVFGVIDTTTHKDVTMDGIAVSFLYPNNKITYFWSDSKQLYDMTVQLFI